MNLVHQGIICYWGVRVPHAPHPILPELQDALENKKQIGTFRWDGHLCGAGEVSDGSNRFEASVPFYGFWEADCILIRFVLFQSWGLGV